MAWNLYMIRCRDNSLYTGITTNVERRFDEHEHGKGSKYLRGKGPLRLEFSARAGTRSRALRLEYWIKRLSKREKERIVELQRLPALQRKKRKKGSALRLLPFYRKRQSLVNLDHLGVEHKRDIFSQ